jgi:hypothetical protein
MANTIKTHFLNTIDRTKHKPLQNNYLSNFMKKVVISFILFSIFAASCTKINDTVPLKSSEPESLPAGYLTVDDAVANLNNFLSAVQGPATKSGNDRIIKSIEAHYDNTVLTRSGESVPDAYLVNFDNDGGFAVLGAKSTIAPVIAVVEQGNTTWDKIMNPTDEDLHTSFDDENTGIRPGELLSLCVNTALAWEGPLSAETKASDIVNVTNPLTDNLLFSQQVTYCSKKDRTYVLNGCASTAISILIAHNNYPQLSVDNELLNYNQCNIENGVGYKYTFIERHPTRIDTTDIFVQPSDHFTNPSSIPASPTHSQVLDLLVRIDKNVLSSHGIPEFDATKHPFWRTRYKLTSAVFYTLNNILESWEATGTLPLAVTSGLKTLGYTNIKTSEYKYMTYSMIDEVRNMLTAGKPVLACGYGITPDQLEHSHYWVIDGIYGAEGNANIHCNWGWEGAHNGWFSATCINCFNPLTDYSYTQDSAIQQIWNKIITYQYDMKAVMPYAVVPDLMRKRIKY